MNTPTARVRKAVIAAAGFGTRFLPQTKAMPKEMLPIVDKPIIQYIVEELVEAGIEDIIIVTGYHKRSIEDHFDNMSAELRANLKAGNKLELLEDTKKISNLANFVYIRQKGVYGTAAPLLNAAHIIGDEPFLYLYADDLTIASPNAFTQMIQLYKEFGGNILPCIRCTSDIEYSQYGIIGGDRIRDDVIKTTEIIEKPGVDKAPSDFASVGGFLFTPEILKYLESGLANLPKGEEFYLTDNVIAPMIRDGQKVFGCEIQNSKRYDTGNKLGYLKTVVDFALKDEKIGPELKEYLRDMVQ